MRPVMLLLCLLASIPTPGRADEWPWPEPRSYHSRGFGFVAEVFPPRSRQNPGERPRAYLYQVEHPGIEWKLDSRRVWQAELRNGRMPYEAVVSMEGVLITLDEHAHVGFENAVVIYDSAGMVVRGYDLEELLSAADLTRVEASESSRWWRKGAQYYVTRAPASRLYIVLAWGTVLELDLQNGAMRRGEVKSFPQLVEIRAQDFANEQVEVWATSLRFSSITDLWAAR